MQYTMLSTRSINIDPNRSRGRRVSGTAKSKRTRRQIKHFIANYVIHHCKQSEKVVRNAGTIKRIAVYDDKGELIGTYGPDDTGDNYTCTGLIKDLVSEIKK